MLHKVIRPFLKAPLRKHRSYVKETKGKTENRYHEKTEIEAMVIKEKKEKLIITLQSFFVYKNVYATGLESIYYLYQLQKFIAKMFYFCIRFS